MRGGCGYLTLALLLVLSATAWADPVTTGVNATATGVEGVVEADVLSGRDRNKEGVGHEFIMLHNRPVCSGGANDGLDCPAGAGDCPGGTCVTPSDISPEANKVKIYDGDPGNAFDPKLGIGTTEYDLDHLTGTTGGGTNMIVTASQTLYMPISGHDLSPSEAPVSSPMKDYCVTGIRCYYAPAPGAGESVDIILRQGTCGGTPSNALTCTVENTNVEGAVSGEVCFTAGQCGAMRLETSVGAATGRASFLVELR